IFAGCPLPAVFPYALCLTQSSNSPSKIFHLTAFFEEFNMMLTNALAIRIANVTVNIPLYKVFSDGK
ncbi:MAG: hypothetical protein C0610_05570, partial [Desulfobacteraceae bacterium]